MLERHWLSPQMRAFRTQSVVLTAPPVTTQLQRLRPFLCDKSDKDWNKRTRISESYLGWLTFNVLLLCSASTQLERLVRLHARVPLLLCFHPSFLEWLHG